MWRTHSCAMPHTFHEPVARPSGAFRLPHRDSPGPSAQAVESKETVGPRLLPPETFPPGTVRCSSRCLASNYHHIRTSVEKVSTLHARVRAPQYLSYSAKGTVARGGFSILDKEPR